MFSMSYENLRTLITSPLLALIPLEAQTTRLSPTAVLAIDRYVTAEIARQRIPGTEVGIYRNGKALFEKGYGMANVELRVPVTPETLMQSGSVGNLPT
jgi:CubicO group peptidase (beta-lactamase class C family)